MEKTINAVVKEKKSNSFGLFLARIKTRMFLMKEKRNAVNANDGEKVGYLNYLIRSNLDNFSLDEVKNLINENLYDLSNESLDD